MSVSWLAFVRWIEYLVLLVHNNIIFSNQDWNLIRRKNRAKDEKKQRLLSSLLLSSLLGGRWGIRKGEPGVVQDLLNGESQSRIGLDRVLQKVEALLR